MNEKQYDALVSSIKHWKAMIAAPNYSELPSTNYCACTSREYNPWPHSNACEGCPIQEYTGNKWGCKGTPYRDAAIAFCCEYDQFKKLAQMEVDFLYDVFYDRPKFYRWFREVLSTPKSLREG